jgi:hypothetical protein
MSKHIRRAVAKKLKEQILEATDPKLIADLANVLAKYLPKPKQIRRPRGAQKPIKETKEPSLNELVEIMERQRKGIALSAEEHAILPQNTEKVA